MNARPGPLLVFGPRSPTYDFGPTHPLTPRRFGPGIDLLRTLGAEPSLAPEPASDDDLQLVHTARYIQAVKRFSVDPFGPPEAGIGPGDNPPFPGMHEAGATVAAGSLRAVDAILRGDVEHAFHPGGGLHHAMPDRASGFCIYDDPALAIARARRDGRRVLYVDLDVHHGDGVQAVFQDDPGVMTISFHESGRYLFPGTGEIDELGQAEAAGTSVNVPFEPGTGETAWLEAVGSIVPPLAAAFGPDLIVSQHGADSHAFDPLAHLLVTTTAMGEAARLVDRLAHRHGTGAWLSTGGGGYDAYRVVPRAWSLVWLAGAHREAPKETAPAWRDRWAGEANRYDQGPPPTRFDDPPNAGLPIERLQLAAEIRSRETAALVRQIVVPGLLREARDRGWWSADEPAPVVRSTVRHGSPSPEATPTLLGPVTLEQLNGLSLTSGVVPPARPADAHRLLASAVHAGAVGALAISGDMIVGVALVMPGATGDPDHLLALGVAPAWRRVGIGSRLLERVLKARRSGRPVEARFTVAERDPVAPWPIGLRREVAARMLGRAGFEIRAAPAPIQSADRHAFDAFLGPAD